MVFHYMNFVQETNIWWLRRIRPIWMTAGAFLLTGIGARYYFFGKIQAFKNQYVSDELGELRAQANKRSYGYDGAYKPTLERSIKKKMMDAQGANYRYAESWPERYMGYESNKTLEQIMEDEDNYE